VNAPRNSTNESSVLSLDAGAREIRRLLTAPDPSLRSALRRQITALQHGPKLSDGVTPRLNVPVAAVNATNDLRGVVRDLYGRIAAIDTKRRDTKRRVLDALDLLDFSLTLLVDSLRASSDTRMAELAREAYWENEQAHAELSRAVQELR